MRIEFSVIRNNRRDKKYNMQDNEFFSQLENLSMPNRITSAKIDSSPLNLQQWDIGSLVDTVLERLACPTGNPQKAVLVSPNTKGMKKAALETVIKAINPSVQLIQETKDADSNITAYILDWTGDTIQELKALSKTVHNLCVIYIPSQLSVKQNLLTMYLSDPEYKTTDRKVTDAIIINTAGIIEIACKTIKQGTTKKILQDPEIKKFIGNMNGSEMRIQFIKQIVNIYADKDIHPKMILSQIKSILENTKGQGVHIMEHMLIQTNLDVKTKTEGIIRKNIPHRASDEELAKISAALTMAYAKNKDKAGSPVELIIQALTALA